MKLNEIKEIKGIVTLKSGLHIGAGDSEMRIGGTDNPVVKHPHTLRPYIPGSSLKGKVRSLLEISSGLAGRATGGILTYKVYKSLDNEREIKKCANILQLFGCSGAESSAYDLGPTRVSFADCQLSDDWLQDETNRNAVLTEIKAETAIDRITGTAKQGSLRMTERVVAGLVFDLSISLKQFEGDGDLLPFLLEGLKLLELDALGGSGSRGYGRVKFTFNDADIQELYDAIQPLN